ncbi:MAG TPA: YbdK family carboxylate-amine ligase [Solirubrobacteraceae bacterium]|jgi:carboxylate-amine ligase|nr:YbdK family carboxylate-amine ligase [Solirubrobacteraceae bacterium]
MEHRFDGPRYTVGVEEELMILDSSSLDLVNAVDSILGEDPPSGQIQPELLESVLEIATQPCANVPAAAVELSALRGLVRDRARAKGLEIGSSGTHPFARWEDQRVVSDDRYRGLIRSLGFVARQELVFGMHVHVGMADPEETIYVANALRPYVPLLIALSANSPLWRGQPTGLMSSRVPIFRAFPRVGLPPRFVDWADFSERVQRMSDSGLIEDYTYLWYDVRPHPRLGTVEVRAMDSQTRVEHTAALSALVVSLVKLLVERFQQGLDEPEPHWEILDENRWLAARHGLEAELYEQSSGERRGVRELADELLAELSPHARELGCEAELEGVRDLLGTAGNGAARQQMVYEANHDLHELMAEIVATTSPDPAG